MSYSNRKLIHMLTKAQKSPLQNYLIFTISWTKVRSYPAYLLNSLKLQSTCDINTIGNKTPNFFNVCYEFIHVYMNLYT